MSHLSISNFKFWSMRWLQLPKWHFPFRTVYLALLFLCIIEILLRMDPVRTLLPQPNPYYFAGVQTRLEALNWLQNTQDDIDLLFVGSSIVRTNISPLQFDAQVGGKDRSVISFNGGLSGLPPDPVALYLEHFWLKHTMPKVVVQGIRLGELQSKITAAEFATFQRGLVEPKWLANDWRAHVEVVLMNQVRLLYYRRVLSNFVLQPRWPLNERNGFAIDERGWSATRGNLAEKLAVAPLESYQGEISDVELSVGLNALRASIINCRRLGIEYVLVNIPEHSDLYLAQPDGQARYRKYLQVLHEFADKEGIRFIDVTNGDLARYQDSTYFSDYHHMNSSGALAFTYQLAEHW